MVALEEGSGGLRCRVLVVQGASYANVILERAPPRRPYGRNFDLEIGLGSIVAYEAEYGPRMTTTARPSLGRRRGTLILSRGLGGARWSARRR